jgi:hypothetical protein
VQNPANNVKLTRLVELAQTLVAIPSVTNQEHEIVEIDSLPAVTRTYVQTAIDLLGTRS